jgi:hypothetical protein
MPTVKQWVVGIAIAITVAIMAVGAVGSVVEHGATQVSTSRFYLPSKAFRLTDHQQHTKVLLGQEDVELPPR